MNKITIKMGHDTVFIDIDDIELISTRDRRLFISTVHGSYDCSLDYLHIIKKLDERFVPILKFTYVNFDLVYGFIGGYIVFKSENKFKLGRDTYSRARKDFSDRYELLNTN